MIAIMIPYDMIHNIIGMHRSSGESAVPRQLGQVQ